MTDFAGQQVVVTGGTGALGSAVVAALLDEDAECHVTWKFEQELEGFDLADAVNLYEVDCADQQSVNRFYADLPGLGASIHIVGGFAMAPITETGADEFQAMMQLNALTAFLCCREAVRNMRGAGNGGRIVNVSARPVMQPYGGAIAYAASKAAVASLTQCLADEVKGDGILVNAVVPSILDTAANRAAMPDADFDLWPKVDDVASTICQLASPENGIGSGALVPVFGKV